MAERPIIFSGPMVRAILAGTKTQTRRVLKLPRDGSSWYRHPETGAIINSMGGPLPKLPYAPGDRLWVREAISAGGWDPPIYRADEYALFGKGQADQNNRWVASIHMPRWASRITLEVTEVRVQRLCEISEEDAIAEGIKRSPHGNRDQWCDYPLGSSAAGWLDPRESFRSLWNSIHGHDAWQQNPWVAAISFNAVARA